MSETHPHQETHSLADWESKGVQGKSDYLRKNRLFLLLFLPEKGDKTAVVLQRYSKDVVVKNEDPRPEPKPLSQAVAAY